MNAPNKVEQPSPPPFSLKSASLDDQEFMKNIIYEMGKGKESIEMIRSIFLRRPRFKVEDGHDHHDLDTIYKALDHHSMVALTSFVTSISMLKSCGFEKGLMRKRNIHHLEENDHESLDGDCKYEGSSSMGNVPRDTISGRGRYKRSCTGEARAQKVTHISDDGFAWRKYGQKTILNTKHPRNYYRCTHKYDQKCVATKQVQQISENPKKYMIIYHGNHTCNNILRANSLMIDTQQHHSSTILLSFDQPNPHNSVLFPTFTNHKSINPETIMPSLSSHDSYSLSNNQQFSRSSDHENVSNCQDFTATTKLSSTPLSEQSDIISTAENYSENSRQDDTEEEEDYSHIWDELGMLEDLYPC